MKTIVSSSITEEEFRANEALCKSAQEYFATDSGAALVFLLREKAKVKSKAGAVQADAIANYSIAEISRLSGVQEAIDLIEKLCEPTVAPKKKSPAPVLGSVAPDDPNLPAKFPFNSEAAAAAAKAAAVPAKK